MNIVMTQQQFFTTQFSQFMAQTGSVVLSEESEKLCK
jgi:hypothetical protein